MNKQPRMPLVNTRVPEGVRDRIVAEARKAQRTVSDFLRLFLVKHFPPKGGKRDA